MVGNQPYCINYTFIVNVVATAVLYMYDVVFMCYPRLLECLNYNLLNLRHAKRNI